MIEAYLRQSPLAPVHPEARPRDESENAGVDFLEIPHRRQFALRGQSSDPAFLKAVDDVLKVSLPIDPCRSSGNADDVHILWMGPDEWLVVAPDSSDPEMGNRLEQALAGCHACVVDVSDSRTTVRLSGIHARETLSKGCSVDLHSRAFSTDHVINTLLAQAHVTLHQISDDDDDADSGCTYDIFVHRSFAGYLWAWLDDAVREYHAR